MGKSRNAVLLKKIALKLKKLRAEKGITQEVFFHDTGINIGRIEKMKRDISVTTLSNICKYLELPMDEFLEGM